ncbi:IscA/HesB family protein [Desulfovibrio mangrovi]|uniref:IscA/HesB family protein n=1 Tax=Desulfovibrio mangrovi TaxID=2976983 RepID=UPI002246CC92|nr:IscA/HesB family protein [Desulfovibrio mangrovi]UZP68403.1 IscA/HesB family protein [Desulfovibrio mangrovi]
MVSLEQSAKAELDAYFSDKDKTPIRIYLAPGGCSGPRLALALDEPNDDDATTETGGYTFAIHKDLFEQVQGVTISVSCGGFSVIPQVPLPSMGGGCSGCGSSSSCCS